MRIDITPGECALDMTRERESNSYLSRIRSLTKDTITANEKNNEINAGEDADAGDAAVSSNSDVHHGIPILTS